ncbi:hypothetical protein [Bacillus coahuilensis]|uniref:hypothetical protein n=1 Tax=Bacillus coahuilensis TaxID=408580 RepID=UPI000185075A|nr:hypothetical protein [Bacillus coahuilensis]
MKRPLVLLLLLVCLYSIYFDLSVGTVPLLNPSNQYEPVETASHSMSFVKVVQKGDTLITIVENEINGSLPVPIDELVADFSKLNNGLVPEEIQIGKEYVFPLY